MRTDLISTAAGIDTGGVGGEVIRR